MTLKKLYLSDKTILIVLAFISAFPPLSTDLYIPALPQMVTYLHTTPARANLTLSMFFVFFGFGILMWGPLSDKYGRKPILYCGLVLYIISSIGCGLSYDYIHLIIGRIFQALGGGAATAVATAIVKDRFSGVKRQRVLAIVMAMVIAAPVVAPVLGSIILKFASWHMIFFSLAGFGLLSLLIVIPLEETIETRYEGSAIRSLGRLFVVLKNPGFSSLLFIFSIIPMPVMAFIASSSYIYIEGFGLSEQAFSLFFSANAIGAMIGPILYLRLAKSFHTNTFITTAYIVVALSGIAVIFLAPSSPYVFALTIMPTTIASMCMRPPSANLMLEQQEGDTGSASSLINFFGMLMGSVGMMLISLGTDNLIFYIGLMQITIGSLGLILWLLVKKRSFIRSEPIRVH